MLNRARPGIAILKNKLNSYNYNERTITERDFNLESADSIDEIPLLEHKFKGDDPLNTFIKLFLLGVKIDSSMLRGIFSSGEIEKLNRLEIFSFSSNNEVTSKIKIYPYRKFHFICDYRVFRSQSEPVYSPGSDSLLFAENAIRKPFGSVLDLCTGTGIQAILASEHSQRVIGVDINPRAVYFANLNLLLNDIDNVEFRLGNLYESVNNETFDLILANPPFVICHKESSLYRDGGEMGDRTLRMIIDGIPKYLNKNGYCQMVTQLSEFEGFSHLEYIREFAERNFYGAFLMSTPKSDSYGLAYGQHKNKVKNYEKYRKTVFNYLDYLDAIKFKNVSLDIVTLKNDKKFKFEKIVSLNRTVNFNVDSVKELYDFFHIS